MNPLILVKISGYFGENKGCYFGGYLREILVVILVKISGYFGGYFSENKWLFW